MDKQLVNVKGITLKGKNRVKEHGSDWEVIKYKDSNLLLKSVKDEYLKWGPLPDFEIIEV